MMVRLNVCNHVHENKIDFEWIQRAVTYFETKNNTFKNNLGLLFKKFNIEETQYFSHNAVIEELRSRIINLILKGNNQFFKCALEKLQRYYLYNYLKHGYEIQKEWTYLECFSWILIESERKNNWAGKELCLKDYIRIIMYIELYCQLDRSYTAKLISQMYPDLWRYTETIIEVERIVPQAVILDGELQNRDEVAEILFKRIEDRIRRYGPVRLLDNLFQRYKDSYNERFHIFKPDPRMTRKFLYHLTLKIISQQSTKEGKKTSSIQIIEHLTETLLNLFDYKIDNQFQLMFLKNDPISYFKKVIYHDALYKETQYPPENILILLENLLLEVKEEFMQRFNLTIEEFLLISNAILNESLRQMKETHESNLRISPEVIYSQLKKRIRNTITIDKVVHYFDVMSSTEPINHSFNHPLDMTSVNDQSQWLIPVDKNDMRTCYTPLPSISSLGFYDRVFGELGYRNLGHSFECFIRKWMQTNFGTQIYSGKYEYKGKVYETDGVMILGNDIILVECKTKTIRKDSRSGKIVSLLTDLKEAYLKSSLQAYRCEAALRQGELSIFPSTATDNEVKKKQIPPIVTIRIPDNPTFYSISCTPFNFGTLNENIIRENVIEALLLYKYHSHDPDEEDGLEKINKDVQELLNLWNDLKTFYERRDGDYFHNIIFYSYFMSFGLLYILTNRKLSKKSPIERIKSFGHIQAGTYNMYDLMDKIIGL